MPKESKKVVVTMMPLCLDLSDVSAAVALSESVIKKLIREGSFPAPRQLSPRRVAWLVREVEEWAEGRPMSQSLPPPSGRD